MKHAIVGVAALGLVLGAVGSPAHADWSDRGLTLPRSQMAFDLGFGGGHAKPADVTGFGFNLGFAWGVASGVELGFRLGPRIGGDGEAVEADAYARPFLTESYTPGGRAWADPELHARWAFMRSAAVELGLEGRVWLPFDGPFGFLVGLPLRLRGGVLRLDSGVYVPVAFHDPTRSVISFPLHVWVQLSRMWLGPQVAWHLHNPGGDWRVPLGFGVGYALNGTTDLKTWLLFRDISGRAGDAFGVGIGLQFRI